MNDYFFDIETNDQQWGMMKKKGKIVNHFQLIENDNKVVDVIIEPKQVQNNIGAKSFTTFEFLHRYISFTFAKKYKNDLHILMSQSIYSSVSSSILEEKVNSLFNEYIRNTQEKLGRIENTLTVLINETKTKISDDENSDDENTKDTITVITTDNLLTECVVYTKTYKPEKPCILQTLQHMLASKNYILCKDMFEKKLNLEQINNDFKLQAYQEMLTEDDLKNLLFIC